MEGFSEDNNSALIAQLLAEDNPYNYGGGDFDSLSFNGTNMEYFGDNLFKSEKRKGMAWGGKAFLLESVWDLQRWL